MGNKKGGRKRRFGKEKETNYRKKVREDRENIDKNGMTRERHKRRG
jgi:hypothetical protein